ncbi:hypothetical protein NFI96_007170 [Prochilodus magdalenae]|nr:hypothetical protein NFI96_007170 [Prochilodus magdalenae]
MTLSRESGKEEEEESSTKVSTSYGTEIELSNQDGSKASGLETAKTDVPQKIIPTEAETQKNFADICPSLIPNVTTHVLEQPFVNDPKVQHQKQTSSELMHFLRMIGKTKNVSEISCVERAFMLMQQQKPNIEAMKRQSFAEMKVSGPIFKVKTSSADFVTYTCMIATHSELWDIGDISIEAKTSKVSGSNGVTFPNCNDSKFLDLFSETVCTSGNESATSDNLEPQCTFEEQADKTTDVSLVRIPEFQIKKFQEIPVLVSHVISPSRFHIQQEDANLQKMSEIMERTRQKSCAEKNCVPDIGTYVMGWFPEQKLWCRAQVTKICGMNRGKGHLCTCLDGVKNLEVEVRRIDYGDSACLSLSNVKELCGEAVKVPLQALQVSLANVNPVNGQNWSAEAIHWFKDKVNGRTLYARLYPEGSKVMVELFMEKGKIGAMRRGASLSLRLAQNGHARHEQMKSMGLKRSHAQEQSRKQSAEWEKYLISRYSQNRK